MGICGSHYAVNLIAVLSDAAAQTETLTRAKRLSPIAPAVAQSHHIIVNVAFVGSTGQHTVHSHIAVWRNADIGHHWCGIGNHNAGGACDRLIVTVSGAGKANQSVIDITVA